jgi:hypothetical protein
MGIRTRDRDHDVVRNFMAEEDADAQATPVGIQKALSLAGGWGDWDWDEMEAALERIRHESTPTPPIEL